MSIPAASGCTTSRLRSCAWIFRAISRRCFRFIWSQPRRVGLGVAWVVFLVVFPAVDCLLRRMVGSPRWLEINPARPGGRKLLHLSIGVEAFPFSRRTPPPSTQPPTPEPRYQSDRNAPKKRTALAAEPGCPADCKWETRSNARNLAGFLSRATTRRVVGRYQDIRFGEEEGSPGGIEIRLEAHRGMRGRCSQCRRPAPGYDRLKERRWGHVPLWGVKTL